MKKSNLFLLVFSLFLMSCGGGKKDERTVENAIKSNDIEQMKAAKAELGEKQHQISQQLAKLTKAIEDLDSNKSYPLVNVVDIKPQSFSRYIEVQSNFNTDENVTLFAEYNGILTDVLVKEGQKVQKGQLLAKINNGGLAQQLVQAEVKTELYKTTFQRQEKLWKQNIGSEMQFLQSKAEYEGSENMVKQLRAQLDKTQIRAPFSGMIDEIMIEKGNMVSQGSMSGVMRILNLDQMFVKADVPESYIQHTKLGTKVAIIVSVLNDTIFSKLDQVGNYINPDNRTFSVEAHFKNKDWEVKPNMNGKLRILVYENDSALVVPQNVVSEDADGNKYVYIVKDKQGNKATANRKVIQIGEAQGGAFEVINGLSTGDEILNEGARTVLDGQKIEILK